MNIQVGDLVTFLKRDTAYTVSKITSRNVYFVGGAKVSISMLPMVVSSVVSKYEIEAAKKFK